MQSAASARTLNLTLTPAGQRRKAAIKHRYVSADR